MRIDSRGNRYRALPAGPGDRLRIVLLCSDDPHHRYLLGELAYRFQLVGTLIEPGHSQQYRLWQRRAYRDWAYRYYQLHRQRLTGRARYRERYFAPMTRALTQHQEDAQIYVQSLNSDYAAVKLAALCPDVTIVCGTGYLGRRLLDLSPLSINVHGGVLPNYRGNHCIFFAYLRSDFAGIGATLHLVSSQLDGGAVLDVVRPTTFPHDHDEHLYCRAVHVGIDRLIEQITAFEEGEPLEFTPQPNSGETFRHRSRTAPLELRLWLRRRLGLHRVPHLPAECWTLRHDGLPARVSDRAWTSVIRGGDRP